LISKTIFYIIDITECFVPHYVVGPRQSYNVEMTLIFRRQ